MYPPRGRLLYRGDIVWVPTGIFARYISAGGDRFGKVGFNGTKNVSSASLIVRIAVQPDGRLVAIEILTQRSRFPVCGDAAQQTVRLVEG